MFLFVTFIIYGHLNITCTFGFSEPWVKTREVSFADSDRISWSYLQINSKCNLNIMHWFSNSRIKPNKIIGCFYAFIIPFILHYCFKGQKLYEILYNFDIIIMDLTVL